MRLQFDYETVIFSKKEGAAVAAPTKRKEKKCIYSISKNVTGLMDSPFKVTQKCR